MNNIEIVKQKIQGTMSPEHPINGMMFGHETSSYLFWLSSLPIDSATKIADAFRLGALLGMEHQSENKKLERLLGEDSK